MTSGQNNKHYINLIVLTIYGKMKKHLQGMTLLTISAIIPTLRPPPCKGEELCVVADTAQLGILYIALLLGALGSGGIRPCVVAFGADQFDESDPKQTTKTWNYFNG